MLVSNLSKSKDVRYLKVKLTGTSSNRDGLGAKVTVHAGGKSYTKIYDGKSGYLSQSSYPLYFGLNDADSVNKIDVAWPSGKTQTITSNIKINTLLNIIEQ